MNIHPFPSDSVFFLGGYDLEMVTIRDILMSRGQIVRDHGLAWGAKSSDYRAEITASLDTRKTPVLVELVDDLNLLPSRIIMVDHHGSQAGKEMLTSLEQIFAGLNLPQYQWSRHYALVSANDRGYIPAMLEINATKDEIQDIRPMDRKLQGITEAEEREAEAALSNLQLLAEGELTVVHLPHRKSAAICDRLDITTGGNGYRNLLIICPGEIDYFGLGSVVCALAEAFPSGSWWGGALPDYGYWGSDQAEAAAVLTFLLNRFDPRQARA